MSTTTTTQSEALVQVVTKMVIEALVETGAIAFGETEVEPKAQRPAPKAKARRSAKPKTPASKVRTLGVQFTTTVTAAKLRKGQVFGLKETGAQYTVLSVLRTANTVTVATDHPKVEQMTLDASRQVHI